MRGRVAPALPGSAEDVIVDLTAPALKAWLRKPDYRRAIREHLETQITQPADVIIAHSLGTVIALDLVSHWPEQDQPSLLLTLGSPLSMSSVWHKLPERNQEWIETRRTNWVNVYDRRDPVTHSGGLPAERFPGVANVRVRNVRPHTADRAHQVARYLSHSFLIRLLDGYAAGQQDPKSGVPDVVMPAGVRAR